MNTQHHCFLCRDYFETDGDTIPNGWLHYCRRCAPAVTDRSKDRGLIARIAGNVAAGLVQREETYLYQTGLEKKERPFREHAFSFERNSDLDDLAGHAVEIALFIIKATDERLMDLAIEEKRRTDKAAQESAGK